MHVRRNATSSHDTVVMGSAVASVRLRVCMRTMHDPLQQPGGQRGAPWTARPCGRGPGCPLTPPGAAGNRELPARAPPSGRRCERPPAARRRGGTAATAGTRRRGSPAMLAQVSGLSPESSRGILGGVDVI